MATRIRMQVEVYKSTEMPEDKVINTFYLQQDLPAVVADTDYQNLCNATAELWRTYRPYPTGWDRITVRAYNMGDPLPRPLKAQSTASPSAVSGACGPREVALCLSFYADRNLKRQRGRLFIGPWHANEMNERPSVPAQNQLAVLAEGIADLGGVDIDWNVYSPTDNAYRDVTDYWVDNEWDTMRSRGLRGTARVTGTVGE